MSRDRFKDEVGLVKKKKKKKNVHQVLSGDSRYWRILRVRTAMVKATRPTEAMPLKAVNPQSPHTMQLAVEDYLSYIESYKVPESP